MKKTPVPDPTTEPTITVARLASLLGVSRGTVYEAVRAGTVPSLRIGRRIVVPTARILSLLGLINEERVPPADVAPSDRD